MFDVASLLNTGFASSLGEGIGGAFATPPAGPSNATAAAYGSGLDSSGWAVNFGGTQNASSSQDKSGGVPGLGSTGIGGAVPWYLWALLAGVVAWRFARSKR